MIYGPTLHAALDEVAAQRPDIAIVFPGEQTRLTLAALRTESLLVAVGLQSRGIADGDRVGALCTNEPDFLRLLFGLSRLGACICPLPLPLTSRAGYSAKLHAILSDGDIKNVVLSSWTNRMLTTFPDALENRGRIAATDLLAVPASAVSADEPKVDCDRDVVLQYTSGSTANPKGVRLTHANVLAGLEAIRAGMNLAPDDRNGLWLPLFHDMGLFGTRTTALSGTPCTVWQPAAFVRNPRRWLREFIDGGHTVTAMPNFAYDYLQAYSTSVL